MTQARFYTPTYASGTYDLRVTRAATVGPAANKFLMGGVSFAAALQALEESCERPTLTASAQFLSFARLDDTVRIEPRVHSAGRTVTQASAVSRVGQREVLRVQAALGARPAEALQQFVTPPPVPLPMDCPPPDNDLLTGDDLGSKVEKRRRHEDETAGIGRHWIRLRDCPLSTASVAIIADHLAGALARTRGSASLDNQLRMVSQPETDWLLCDTTMAAFSNGFLHGTTHLFAEDGSLVAIASQTAALPTQGGAWAQSHVRQKLN
ncbi:MAG: hypothetical protein AAF648_14890 [Pseudomonadota bacterium]